MIFKLGPGTWPVPVSGWPVGGWLIPVGTVINTSAPQWRGLPAAPPPNAEPMDQASYTAMLAYFPANEIVPAKP